MPHAFISDAVRTPFGRYGGFLARMHTDDLAAIPLRALLARCPKLDAEAIDDVILGCANQSGEDNRNVARMALLVAGVPDRVPGTTVNRLCGSSLEAAAVHVNPNGGAIALGHPLGGARLLGAAVRQLERSGGRYALCTMCIGVGQGIATLLVRV